MGWGFGGKGKRKYYIRELPLRTGTTDMRVMVPSSL